MVFVLAISVDPFCSISSGTLLFVKYLFRVTNIQELKIELLICHLYFSEPRAGLFQQLLEKAPVQNLEKLSDFTSKFGKINGIEHNKGIKISPKSSYFRLYYAKHTT